MSKKSITTEVSISRTWKFPVFEVFEVDEIGTKQGVYPVVSFGLKKAKAIVNHLDDIKQFIKEESK